MELLDVYTRSHERTGRITVRGALELAAEERVLAVHVGIFNSDGRMLIQKRQTTKKRYPGCWDVSAGGLAQQGEDSLTGVRREAKEELGLTFAPEELTFAMTAEFDYMLDDFFLAHRDVEINDLRLQQEEVLEARWATEEEMLAMQREGAFVDYDGEIIRALFDMDRKMRM